MKKLSVIFASLVFAIALEAQTQNDLIARIHFLGGDKISTDVNSGAFAKEFTSSQARALENQTLDKLSKLFVAKFKSKTFANTDGGLAQLRPLLDDLLTSEWIFEVSDVNGAQEYKLAIHLSTERANFWSKNLQMPLENWMEVKVPQSATGILWIKEFNPSSWCFFARSGGYMIIDFGQGNLNDGLLRFAESKMRTVAAETNWLSADLNWPRLAQLFPSLREFDFPKIAFQVVGRDGNFHFTGKLDLSQPLPSLEKWRVPTNVIHQPFVSFTAARGVAPWLEKQSWFQPYIVQPQPEQIFVWALPMIPFQTFAAEPVANANASLAQLHENLSANANWQSQFMMPVHMILTNNQLNFAGVPFIAPFIHADHEADGDFLFGGFFPNTPRSKPLPPELFTELNTPNLVYYHWEITGARLQEMPELSQLLLMVTKHRQLGSAAHEWLEQFGPALGNCVTTVTETSPTELSFTRKAPGGLTAIELLALANWLESPDFPALDLRLPPRPKLRPGAHPKILSGPPMKFPSAPPAK